jgi:hypothetical protein
MWRKLTLSVMLLCGCAVVAAVTLAPPARAQSNASDTGLTVVGASTRTVALPRTGNARRVGLLTVVLHNSTVEPGILQLKFFATTTGRTVQLTGGRSKPSDVVHLVPLRPNLRLAAGDSTQLTLAFQLTRGQPLQDADGMLFARMVPVPRQVTTQKDPPSAQVHVFATLGTATFLPDPVKLQVQQSCWFSGACGDSTAATLQGPDARALLLAAPTGDALLSNAAGQTIHARVDDLTGTGNIVRARIRVTGLAFGKVGTFTGRVGLGPSPERGPSVDITAAVGVWFGWLVVFLFAGSLIGGFLSLSARIWRRRRLLKLEVEEAIGRYKARLTASLVQRSTEDEPWVPYSYDLTPLLGREVRDGVAKEQGRTGGDQGHEDAVAPLPARDAALAGANGAQPAAGATVDFVFSGAARPRTDASEDALKQTMEPFPAERGLRALLWRIGTARTEADFADDAATAHNLIDCIDRWRDVEEACANAHRVLKHLDDERPELRHPPDDNDGRAFRDRCSIAIHDLRALRSRAHEFFLKGKPEQLASHADDLVRRINRQVQIISQLQLIWTMDCILSDRRGWTKADAAKRLVHEASTLDQGSGSEEARCKADSGRDAHVAFLTKVSESSDWYWSKFKKNDWPEVYRQAFGVRSLDEGRQLVNERQARAQRSGHVLPPAPKRSNPVVDGVKVLKEITYSDLCWTMAIALVTVVAYALTAYGTTWGSPTDMLTAFTTGFVTVSLVNWAALPAFQSIRSRWTGSTPTEPKTEADKADAKPSDSTAGTGDKSAANPLTVVASAIAGSGGDNAEGKAEQPSLTVRFTNPVP